MSFLDTNLGDMTPPVLLELADHIHTFANQVKSVANENERRLSERRNNGHSRRSVRAASAYFSELIEKGIATEEALDMAAAKYCVQPQAVKMTVTLFKAKQRHIEKIKRDREIMKLYRAGYPSPVIARRAGVTLRTVQRVTKELKSV